MLAHVVTLVHVTVTLLGVLDKSRVNIDNFLCRLNTSESAMLLLNSHAMSTYIFNTQSPGPVGVFHHEEF